MLISEAIEFLREKREQGYMTQEFLLELYRNGDWIDDDFLHSGVCYFIPEPPKPFELYLGIDAYNQLNKMIEDFIDSEIEKQRRIQMN